MSLTWDATWDCNPRPLNHIYNGAALYRKTVEIPADWADREIWLNVGGVRTEAYFWANGRPLGAINGFCGSWKFRVGDAAKAGETVEIVALVRNDTPSRKGQMCDFHKFGGFYRDLELEATPKVWLDDVWVRGEILAPERHDAKTAQVRVALRSTLENASVAKIDVAIKELGGERKNVPGKIIAADSFSATVEPGKTNDLTLEVPIPNDLRETIKNWTPERPTLYLAEITLENADGSRTGWTERFGFRRLEVRGNRFYLNGTPYFLRGYGETFVYPDALVSPVDRDVHRANMRVIKRAGFNAARMHTHCEIPEYFEAADELGILLQPELPYYRDVPTEAFAFDPMRDIAELNRHYRRYTSFAIYSMGNEGWLGAPLDAQLHRWRQENDPDRLTIHQDGGTCSPENSDFTSTPTPPVGLILPWPRGLYDDLDWPFVAHEYMNQTVMLDPRLEPKFDGALPSPVSLSEYEAKLARFGLSREQGDACVRAAHALQAWRNKEGVESARIDPACDGFSFWNLIDQMVIQGDAYTSQGFLNAFYETKDGGASPEDFREYNGPTSIIAIFNQINVYESGDFLTPIWTISHFDENALPTGSVRVKLIDVENGETLLNETFSFESVAPGEVVDVETSRFETPQVERPRALELVAEIEGTDVRNRWPVWVFPKRVKPVLKNVAASDELFDCLSERYDGLIRESDAIDSFDSETVVITRFNEDSYRRAKEAGRRTVVLCPTANQDNFALGWWSFGQQLGTASFDAPALGDFPADGTTSQLWFRILKSDPIDLANPPQEVDAKGIAPIVLGQGTDTYFLYLGEDDGENGAARRLVVAGLNLTQDLPEALYLLDSLIERASQVE